MTTRWSDAHRRGGDYDRGFVEQAAAGIDVHGEAAFVAALAPARVLDAGCGTGRVAIELARRGVEVTGVDADPGMLEEARRKAPELDWVDGDLSRLDLRDPRGGRRRYDVAVMAGNVMLFVASGTEAAVVARVAEHIVPGGALVSGFQVIVGALDLAAYDGFCAAAGLRLVERWATWDRAPWQPDGEYAVSVHRVAEAPGSTMRSATAPGRASR